MDINATLIGQMITFALFIWFTMKFVWPLLEEILKARQEKIAEGLQAAERGHKELEVSQKYAIQHIHEARAKAVESIEQAKKQAANIVEQAKLEANHEREKIIAQGHQDVQQERDRARMQLQQEVVTLAIASAEKLIGRALTAEDQKRLLEKEALAPAAPKLNDQSVH